MRHYQQGRKLRYWREAKELTQEDVSKHLNIHPGTVSKWETGLRPSFDESFKLEYYTKGIIKAEAWGDPTVTGDFKN